MLTFVTFNHHMETGICFGGWQFSLFAAAAEYKLSLMKSSNFNFFSLLIHLSRGEHFPLSLFPFYPISPTQSTMNESND